MYDKDKLSNYYLACCSVVRTIFLFVDQVEHVGDLNQIDIKAMLLEIRQYRVGLIQTPDQLRFTYLAILEGVRVLMPEIYQRAENHHFNLQTNAGK